MLFVLSEARREREENSVDLTKETKLKLHN